MNISFRYKFIFSFVLLETVFLSLIFYFNLNFINNSSYKLIIEREHFLKNFSSKVLLVPVSMYDIATIDNISKTIAEDENVRYIEIYDNSNLILSKAGNKSSSDKSIVNEIPLVLDNLVIGNLRIWLDFDEALTVIENHKNTMLKIIILELLVSLFMAYIIGYSLSKNLEKLKDSAEKLGEDEEYEMEIIKSNDEINILSKSMIKMNNKIKERTSRLKEINEGLDTRIKEEIDKNKEKDKLLFEQSKLASMGEMIGNIAHQWRQPLSVISSSATGLMLQNENNLLTNEILKENCKYINDNVQYLSKTIDDFREFIKVEKDKSHFEIAEVIKSFEQLSSPIIKQENIRLIINQRDNVCLFNYPNEFLQVLLNIFNNSKDALVLKEIKNKFILLDLYKVSNKYIIEFRDNALGVDEKVLDQMYEPYFTTKHKNVGTGLGLSIVYNLITNGIGGKVRSENTNFTFEDKNYKGLKTTIEINLD